MTSVIALIHGEEGAFGISFPDFPGLASGGTTLDEAFARGREGLATHIEALLEDGEEIRAPRGIAALKADPDLAEDFADAVLVAALDVELPTRSVRVNISVDEGLLSRIDRKASELGLNRSAFLAEAARAKIAMG